MEVVSPQNNVSTSLIISEHQIYYIGVVKGELQIVSAQLIKRLDYEAV